MLILAVECSAKAASAALLEDGKILGEFYVNTIQTHSETLMPMTKNLLQATKKEIKDINLFAVSAGPGSFTGIRIGIACVKGLAFGSEISCCPVSTLDAIAYGAVSYENRIVCAVMDARCNQVYNALYRIKNGTPIKISEERAIKIDDLLLECEAFKEPVLFIGDGAEICYTAAKDGELFFAQLAPQGIRLQKASYVAIAAERKYIENKDIVFEQFLQPVYLRIPQAERELKKKQENS